MKKLTVLLAASALALAACSTPAWNETDKYNELCSTSPSLDPQLSALESVEAPEGGHIQMSQFTGESVNIRVCTPATGDELREYAEKLAIEVNKLPIAGQVERMGVHSWPDDEAPEARISDKNFQMNLHDGGEAFENGAYRGAWEAVADEQ